MSENKDIEKSKRVLTSIGSKCPMGCVYCFVENENYSVLPKIDNPLIEETLQKPLETADIIQPSADVEFFLAPDYLSTLQRLVSYKKSISFATKSRISIKLASTLATYHASLRNEGAILQIAVSIVCLNDWQIIEPFTPSPKDRIQSLKNLYEQGIPTTVAVRPMLPFTTPEEIEEIVSLTHPYTYGYLSGPVYLTPGLKEYMRVKGLQYPSTATQVEWLPNKPTMEVIFSQDLEYHLKLCARQRELPVFESNIKAVEFLRNICVQ